MVYASVLEFSRETEPKNIEIYYEEMAHTVVEAEKSHSLQAEDPGKPVV